MNRSRDKKAILMVSFGTSHLDTLEKNIAVIERQAAETFPDYTVYRAFTSGMILRKLQRTQNLHICTVREAMEQMRTEQVTEVLVQPTHIIPGLEYEKMLADVKAYGEDFRRITVGEPLLMSGEDYKRCVRAVMEEIPFRRGKRWYLWDMARSIRPMRLTRCWNICSIIWATLKCWWERWRVPRTWRR